jgi:plasmid stabilization system protein ParE
MRYRVVIELPAWQDIDEAYEWLRKRVPEHAVRWFNGLEAAILGLASQPERCPVAPESEKFDRDMIRRNTGHVLHVRHGKRRRLGEEASDE